MQFNVISGRTVRLFYSPNWKYGLCMCACTAVRVWGHTDYSMLPIFIEGHLISTEAFSNQIENTILDNKYNAAIFT